MKRMQRHKSQRHPARREQRRIYDAGLQRQRCLCHHHAAAHQAPGGHPPERHLFNVERHRGVVVRVGSLPDADDRHDRDGVSLAVGQRRLLAVSRARLHLQRDDLRRRMDAPRRGFVQEVHAAVLDPVTTSAEYEC